MGKGKALMQTIKPFNIAFTLPTCTLRIAVYTNSELVRAIFTGKKQGWIIQQSIISLPR